MISLFTLGRGAEVVSRGHGMDGIGASIAHIRVRSTAKRWKAVSASVVAIPTIVTQMKPAERSTDWIQLQVPQVPRANSTYVRWHTVSRTSTERILQNCWRSTHQTNLDPPEYLLSVTLLEAD